MKQEPVTAYLNGGLGNQLFIWAAAYEIAERNKADLILNISNIKGREFGLNEFDLDPIGLSVSKLRSYEIQNILMKRLWILRHSSDNYFERRFNYCDEVSRLGAGTAIHGYFQSTRYFENTASEIKRQLKLRNPSKDYLEIEETICDSKSLIIHVRKGDYQHSSSQHKVLTQHYYLRALRELESCYEEIFVFTDDLDWAQEIVTLEARFITKEKVGSAAENLVLMSKGKLLIGANSTFSLWAGILMDSPDVNKCFPQNWFHQARLNTSSLIPDGMKIISN